MTEGNDAVFINNTSDHRYDTFWRGSLKIARQQSRIDFGLILLKTLPPNLAIEDFAAGLFEKHRIGKYTGGKGVLLLYLEAEHAMKIEVGYALEPVFTDAITHHYEDAAKSFILSANIGDFMTEIMVTMAKHYETVSRNGSDDVWDITAPAFDTSLSRHLSGGAGAVGRGYAQIIEDTLREIRSVTRFQPSDELQPSSNADETLERYLATLAAGVGDPNLPLLTAGSRLFRIESLRNSSYQKRTYEFYRRAMPYELQVQEGLAAAIFRDNQPVWPIYLRKDARGLWYVDEAGSWAHTHIFENLDQPFQKHDDNPFAFAWKRSGRWRSENILYPGKTRSPRPLSDPNILVEEIKKREFDLAAHPSDPARYFSLGDLLYFEAYWQEAAVRLYLKGLELSPDRLDYHWRLAEIYPNICEIEPLLSEYEAILRITPTDAIARKEYQSLKEFYGPLMKPIP